MQDLTRLPLFDREPLEADVSMNYRWLSAPMTMQRRVGREAGSPATRRRTAELLRGFDSRRLHLSLHSTG
jgi:hypothetical protein